MTRRPAEPSSLPAHRWPVELFCLFTLSGVSGLMLEVVWSRMLTTLLGVTTWGLLTILVTYMGGLGLGAIVLGRRISRSENPLRIYAALEIGIGLYALAIPFVFRLVAWLYALGSRWEESTGLTFAGALRLAAAFLALGIPTFLLGGTFPALVRSVGQRSAGGGRGAAILYALNTAGAVLGCFVTGFVLIGQIGVFNTNALAAAIDIGIGLIAWRLGQQQVGKQQLIESVASSPEDNPRGQWLILLVAAYAGFCGLAFEVLWTRGLLVALVDNTTYAFSMMLSAFLLGHALGSGWFGSRQGTATHDQLAGRLAWVLAIAGFMALISLPTLVLSSDLAGLSYGEGVTFWGRRVPVQMSLCLLVICPTAAALGGAFALSARLTVASGKSSARQSGRLYGLNTIGAILGAILTQILAIPVLGTQRSLMILALGLVFAGACLLVRFRKLGGLAGAISMAMIATALAAGYEQFSLIGLYASKERQQRANAPARLLGVIESPSAIVTVHDRGTDDKVINLNGTNVAGTNPVLRTIQTLQGELPLLLHPDPKSVLQIGFGSGGTYSTLSAARPEGLSIEVLELTPEVIQASERWLGDINGKRLSASSDRVTINDARSHMAATARNYDLILSDSIHPRFRGNASLYSRDYFELCAARLRPGGLFSTWLPLYGISTEDLRGIFASLQSVFPHVQIWYPNAEPNENTILVGSREPIRIDYRRFERVLGEGTVSTSPANRLRMTPVRVLDFFVMGDSGVARFAKGGMISTDDRPYLEFQAPRTLQRQESWRSNLEALAADRESVLPYVSAMPEPERAELARWEQGTHWKCIGQEAELRRDFQAAVSAYTRCIEINPSDQETRRRRDGLARLVPGNR